MLKNTDQMTEARRNWVLNNREKSLAINRAYYNRHWRAGDPYREAVMSRNKAQEKRRYRDDPEFRLVKLLRRRLQLALRGADKAASTLKLLGCTIPELRAHLEARFQPGMTWDNYGPVWHVDHIRPCASFDLTDPAQQRACFNWSNTQPLFAKENLKKGGRDFKKVAGR